MSVKGDGLGKLYDRMTLDELVRLRLAALARDDRAEYDRVDRAVPFAQYDAYRDRLAASEVLTLCGMVALLPLLAKLQMLDAVRALVELLEGAASDAAWLGYLDGHRAGWKAAGKRGEPPDVPDDTLTQASERAYGRGTRISGLLAEGSVELAGQARTSRDALAAFALERLGVTLDVLLGAWATPALATLAEHAEALDAAEPGAEGLALLGDVMAMAWRKHGLNEQTAELDEMERTLREQYEAALREETP